MSYKKVAVVGAGAMGSGIAQVMAAASVQVVLIDIAPAFVESGIKRIEGKFASDVKKGKMIPEDKERFMGCVQGSVNQEDARLGPRYRGHHRR